jgi:tRNA pseudouridine55 synthase
MNGVLIIDKPSGLTSHDVVNRVRRILGQRAVGHLGTLDPSATGVLPIVLGGFTRLAQFYTESEKIYEGVIRFGFATDTYDAEGDPIDLDGAHVGTASSVQALNLDQLRRLAASFVGVIEQTPPPFSAKKIKGVPAYKLARKHQAVELRPVQVEIKEFAITSIENDCATFRARVASGTYMRSVAHEMGQRLGCGAHLASLRRTGVAEFDITQAHTLEAVEASMCGAKGIEIHRSARNDSMENEACSERDSSTRSRMRSIPLGMTESGNSENERAEVIRELCIHPRQLLPHLPSVTADEATAARIRNGRPINLPDLSRARQVKVFADQRELIAIASRVAGTLFHPKIVFTTEDAAVRC